MKTIWLMRPRVSTTRVENRRSRSATSVWWSTRINFSHVKTRRLIELWRSIASLSIYIQRMIWMRGMSALTTHTTAPTNLVSKSLTTTISGISRNTSEFSSILCEIYRIHSDDCTFWHIELVSLSIDISFTLDARHSWDIKSQKNVRYLFNRAKLAVAVARSYGAASDEVVSQYMR